jgi:ankyrin repeat protein
MMASGESRYSQKVSRQATGVHLAAYFGLKEVMMALLKNGHDLDSEDTDGRTPLLFAVWSGHKAVARLLLEKGARIEAKDKFNGQTPMS